MKIPAIFAIFLFTFFAGCTTTPDAPPSVTNPADSIHPPVTEYGEKVIHLNLPNRLNLTQIQQAILNAGVSERWVMIGAGVDGDSGVVQLQKKSIFAEATFTFLFQPTAIDGYSASYRTDVTGKPTGNYTPPLWIDNIREAIRKNLEKSMAGF